MNDVYINVTAPRNRLKPTPAVALRLFADKKGVRYIPTHTHIHTRIRRIHARLHLKPNNHAGLSLFGDRRRGVCIPHTGVSFKRINIYIFFVYVIGETHASRGFQEVTGTVCSVYNAKVEAAPCL